jgi:hypothetical protein
MVRSGPHHERNGGERAQLIAAELVEERVEQSDSNPVMNAAAV